MTIRVRSRGSNRRLLRFARNMLHGGNTIRSARTLPTSCRRVYRVTLVALAVIVMGCSPQPSGPDTVPVRGSVTLDGVPVEGADVYFMPVESGDGLTSQSQTDAEGKFAMSTQFGEGQQKAGLPVGVYGVEIIKLEAVTSLDRPPKNLLPKKYAAKATSRLSADVQPGSPALDLHFELRSK